MDRKRASALQRLGRNRNDGQSGIGRWLPQRRHFQQFAPPHCFISALALSLMVGSGVVAADPTGVYIHDQNKAKVDNDRDHISNEEGPGVRIDNISGNVSVKNRYGRHWDDARIEGSDEGVRITDVGGKISIDNSFKGKIIGHGADGIYIDDAEGRVSIDNHFGGRVSGRDDGVHIRDVDDHVTIDNRFGGSITGKRDDGIDIKNVEDDVSIDNRFGGKITGRDNGIQIEDVDDDVEISNSYGGKITGWRGDGIRVEDTDGDVSIENKHGGRITGRDDGIHIENTDDDVKIDNRFGGRITGKKGDGVDIRDVNDDVKIDNRFGGRITGHDDGVKIRDVGEDVTITNSHGGKITGEKDDGIDIKDVDDVRIDNSKRGKISGRDNGIQIEDADDVVISNKSGGSISGKRGDGINLDDVDYVEIDNKKGGKITGHDDGIHIEDASGDIEIDNRYGGSIKGKHGDGVDIRDADDDVEIDNRFGGKITGHDDGIKIRNVDDDVTIANNYGGKIRGEEGDGVNVRDVEGDVEIYNRRGSIKGYDDGIKIRDVDGDVTVDNDSGIIQGRRDTGVDVEADGSVTIDNDDGTIKGRNSGISIASDSATINSSGLIESSGQHNATIDLSTDDGATINNYAGGLIRTSRESTSDLIVDARGGAVTINNDGTMIGRIDLSEAGNTDTANTFNNTSNDSWHFTGTSNLGDGLADAFNNTGTIYTTDPDSPSYNDATVLAGVEFFNNGGVGGTGTIDLQDGYTGDTFTLIPTDGGTLTFHGADGQSALKVDAFLAGPSNSNSDTLVINGDVTGSTAIYVNNVNAGFGAYNPTGIDVVNATGSLPQGSFYLADGPIKTGMFQYDLYLNGSNEWVLASSPSHSFFELPSLTSAAQSVWHNASDAWLDRTADLRTALNTTCAPVSLKDSTAGCAKPASGAWAKVLGASESRSTNHSFTLMNTVERHSVNSQLDGGGVIAGYDVIRTTEGGNGIWMAGVMGGYLRSKLNFDGSANSADFQSGAVGAYVTYLQGGWFIDGQFMANLGNVKYSGVQSTNEHAGLTAVGGVIDAGYRATYNNAFIEPGATLSYVNASIDTMEIYDTSVNFSSGDSLRGRLGVRVGTTIAKERAKYEPFIGVGAIYEFLGNNTADVTSGDYVLETTDNLSGALGEVTGGVNMFSLTGNGLSAFAKGNVQFGKDDFVGYGGSLGVRVDW
ncbi:autotransporter domain-containing protein [Hyphomicrobium facile]|uniref:Uncharacterized conserved protein, contains a C-terminal beta-barrel porin domain n=1 Tax=Hyphomicrobium facile TaxID=51670 RepID=A0A1I7NJ09_9HYPH|nr:autotransporter domain-containing protein [Hyphomicrobium facile]SFV34641.1 Uncharacterized conserved protein, contains a C-terminal beta-barrel porin domain [Hyphomicrobium facile]